MPEQELEKTTRSQSGTLCEDGNDSKLAWPDSSAKIGSKSALLKIKLPHNADGLAI
jgi:hypothetical protein